MFKAIWNGVELASGTDVIQVEGRLYFPPGSVRCELLRAAPDRSVCEWKGGEATYFDLVVGGEINRAAAWTYPLLSGNVEPIAGRIAFWKDVVVGWQGPDPAPIPPCIEAKTPNVAKALGVVDVIWRPSQLPGFAFPGGAATFEGYLIPSRNLLVDVLATPPEHERAARIAEARARAEAICAWNGAHPTDRYGYVAVWGSAMPNARTTEMLRRGGVLLALAEEPIVFATW